MKAEPIIKIILYSIFLVFIIKLYHKQKESLELTKEDYYIEQGRLQRSLYLLYPDSDKVDSIYLQMHSNEPQTLPYRKFKKQ